MLGIIAGIILGFMALVVIYCVAKLIVVILEMLYEFVKDLVVRIDPIHSLKNLHQHYECKRVITEYQRLVDGYSKAINQIDDEILSIYIQCIINRHLDRVSMMKIEVLSTKKRLLETRIGFARAYQDLQCTFIKHFEVDLDLIGGLI